MTTAIPRVPMFGSTHLLGSLGAVPGAAVRLWRAWRAPATPIAAKAVLAAGVLYVLMPFDLVTDLVPVLGWLDDAAVLPLAIAAFGRLARRGGRGPIH